MCCPDSPAPAIHLTVISWPLATPILPLVYLPGFMVGAVAAAVRVMCDVVASQRANDPAWKRTDFRTVQGGMMADWARQLHRRRDRRDRHEQLFRERRARRRDRDHGPARRRRGRAGLDRRG